jgi:deoxyribodipyrimidine photo-lyase
MLGNPHKKIRRVPKFLPNKIATAENAANVDTNLPLNVLMRAVKDGVKAPVKGEAVVYWMRMSDLRGMFDIHA